MPKKRLSMRKIKEVLRLHFELGLSRRQIGRALSISHNSVREYLQRFADANLSWPVSMADDELEHLLFPTGPSIPKDQRVLPDWKLVHKELKRKSVTLFLLWEEYKQQSPSGYQYSQFCHLYKDWSKSLNPVMRLQHKAGEVLFVDYAGQTVPVTDPFTGEVAEVQIFVATLAASGYLYAEATKTQSLPDWIGSHCRALNFFGGVPEVIVPDNLKSGVTSPCRYEPDINLTYADMANHYGAAVIPARVRKPRDKAKVETSVGLVERRILAKLRNHTFFSIQEANQAIFTLLEMLNKRPFQKIQESRHQLFLELDKPALKPLPPTPYEYAEWKKVRVNIDYHVEIHGHYYSVPYQLIHKQLDARIAANTVECFLHSKRMASHRRSFRKGHHTTVIEHMPKNHQHYVQWTPERILDWAAKIGPHTKELIKKIIEAKSHPQQGFRAAMGILRLGKAYKNQRLECACQKALKNGLYSYRSINSMLKSGLDQETPARTQLRLPIAHENIRGANYYQ